ncbi:PREDICTED: farnesol dehydrogenase-like [Polistes dominula]|uniref:Farnesol dehydrogenase-like n=1 Tax=Polistes dominula TaxID=743375 RepID=A0ABM1ILT8_POLDO|nr:PREDICTED: farnesol dehydrogenase-like [Polistes dominula]
MERWSGKVAIVTGASCGIGLAIAKALVQHDVVVIGFARRKSKMENLSPGIVDTDIFKTSNVEFHTDEALMPYLKPEDIADGVIYIIGTPQRVHIAELIIRPLGELKYEYQ